MATPIPAIKGKMGSTPYYVATMAARDLISTTRPAAEDRDAWTSASIDERMQREPNLRRVRDQIVPYLAQHKDRFFGSIIVVVPEGSIDFDPRDEVRQEPAPRLPPGGRGHGIHHPGKGRAGDPRRPAPLVRRA